jgi:hypothetical protein
MTQQNNYDLDDEASSISYFNSSIKPNFNQSRNVNLKPRKLFVTFFISNLFRVRRPYLLRPYLLLIRSFRAFKCRTNSCNDYSHSLTKISLGMYLRRTTEGSLQGVGGRGSLVPVSLCPCPKGGYRPA